MKPASAKRRRLIIQLAALVDLLFVVMFLQYTDQTRNVAQVIQMLRKSSELKNWCDIWEVHLYDDGRARVRAPNVPDREILPNDENDFALQFMQIVKQAGDPKGLVIIMFTHGNAYLKS